MFAIQVASMSLKGGYISYIVTSKQVDKQRSDFQLYSDETLVFLVSAVAALMCRGWSLVSKRLPKPLPMSCASWYKSETGGCNYQGSVCSEKKKKTSLCWRYLRQLRWGSFLYPLINGWFFDRRQKYWQSQSSTVLS